MSEFDVIIIGGGATGAGTLRDCAMRGLKCLLIEKRDISNGATGRNHGLLHSGARYAVTDQESARECIGENMILRKIARHCVDETDGFFLSMPDDDLGFQSKFVDACHQAGIRADVLDPAEARRLEPAMNPDAIGAVRVPDGSVDPFRLTAANIKDGIDHGGKVLTYHEVEDFVRRQDRIEGVRVRDMHTGEIKEFRAKIVVNAGGIWGSLIARQAGVTVNMFPAKGALLIYGHRANKIVLNRCRKPSNADILVPGDTICVIGTTSTKVPFDQVDDMRVLPEEVKILRQGAEELSPMLKYTRIMRAYAGVRPLVASDADPSGRSISRGIVLFDHEKRDGLKGFLTITGGKLMTYRLMAKEVTDKICEDLHIDKQCQTADIPLPGSRTAPQEVAKKIYSMSAPQKQSIVYRHGDMAPAMLKKNTLDRTMVCECESVSYSEVEYAIDNLHVNNLVDLRRRTRVGMGSCQGEFCACRAMGILAAKKHLDPRAERLHLADFLNERWKGVCPIASGNQLRESQFSAWVYENVCGLTDDK